MYQNSYEEYMRNSLGYQNMMGPMPNMNGNNEIYEEENNFTYNQNNIDKMYPEIYHIIYPMVCKACMNIQENITEDLVSRMTNDIYTSVENMEMPQETRSIPPNATAQSSKSTKSDSISTSRVTPHTNTTTVSNSVRQENRNRNPLLRDLIRILVLRELVGNQERPRPPFRPPYGGGFNPGPGPRPYLF